MAEYYSEPYTVRYIKKQIIDQYGDDVIIADRSGVKYVVYFFRTSKNILHNFHSNPRLDDIDEEKKRLLKSAAELIRMDIKSIDSDLKPIFHWMH